MTPDDALIILKSAQVRLAIVNAIAAETPREKVRTTRDVFCLTRQLMRIAVAVEEAKRLRQSFTKPGTIDTYTPYRSRSRYTPGTWTGD